MTEMIPLGPDELARPSAKPRYLLTAFTVDSTGRYLRCGQFGR
jgi:hypothetical protein